MVNVRDALQCAAGSLLLYGALCEIFPPFAWLLVVCLPVALFGSAVRYMCREPWSPTI